MPALITTLILLFALSLPTPCEAFTVTDLSLGAGFYSPHGEQVVGDKVGRYRLDLQGEAEQDRLTMGARLYLFGVNTWQKPHIVGHGFDAWDGSDWAVEDWRWEVQFRAGWKMTDRASLFYEHWRQEEFQGHQSYSDLWGLRLRLR